VHSKAELTAVQPGKQQQSLFQLRHLIVFHQVAGVLQPLPIPSWKWEDISMDFIVGLPNTSQRHDSIWVIVDRLTKTAIFLPVHTAYNAKKYVEIYLDRIVRLHGVPITIISDHGAQFIAHFWEQL
jgi:hypothetical protein